MNPGQNETFPVLIAGGGGVGLALAAELGRHGVRCLVVEQTDGTIDHPRASELNARTMEFCRRWGIADRVREAGTPRDFPNSALFVTSLTGYEIARVVRPGHAGERPFPHGPERAKRCNQLWFNPILRDHAAALEGVTLRHRCRFESFEQGADGVTAVLHDLETDRRETVEAQYLVACCGGNSSIPAALGVAFDDSTVLSQSINIFFRSPELWKRHDKGPSSLNFFIQPEGMWAGMTTQNGRDLWRVTVHGTKEYVDPADVDAGACLRRVFGGDFPFEIISVVPWTRRSWVADRYAFGRVFLAGDAAHQCSPTGGFGLNTGLGDAVDLGWKLAAAVQGWAGKGLLESYDTERRPVGLRNIGEATGNYERYEFDQDTAAICEETAEGERVRREIGEEIMRTRARQFLSEGIALGYRYDPSPICWPDGAEEPPDPVSEYVPTARPGHRAPHAWLGEGRSVLDEFGDGFVLLRMGDSPPDPATLEAAARVRGVPFRVADIADPEVHRLYERALALVRPDGHVAWRGDTPPESPETLIDRVIGAAA